MANRSKDTTHKIMSSIKQKDTEPELMLRHALWAKGMRYRKNVTKILGKPDIVFSKQKIVVFCDGDFWHGHNWAIRGMSSLEEELSSYSQFWREKIIRNIERDQFITNTLESEGWIVIRLWESDIRKDTDSCVNLILDTICKRNEMK